MKQNSFGLGVEHNMGNELGSKGEWDYGWGDGVGSESGYGDAWGDGDGFGDDKGMGNIFGFRDDDDDSGWGGGNNLDDIWFE